MAALEQRVEAAADLAGGQRDRLRHLGFDEAGGDGVDRDALLAELGGQRLGEADHARLRRRVVGLPAVTGDARHRRQTDDAAALTDGAVAHQPFGKLQRCQQVHRDHAVPPGFVHVRQQLVAGDPGIVDQDVELAFVVLAHVFGDAVHRVGGGDVQGQRGAADLGRGLGEGLGGVGHVDGDDLGAVAGEHLGDRGADPAGGAGDQGDLAVERAVPVRRRGGVGRADVEHLTVDVGRLRRQQETQRRLQSGGRRFRVGRQVHQRDGGAVAQLLAQ